jgi:aspartyl-tRNA(Asn)/glutamyl-tRNA(Gln) amidotransferase subunit A
MINLNELTIKKVNEMYKSGELTPVQLVDLYLEEIKNKNPELNAVLEVFDDARSEAERIKDFTNPLAGIPIILKDNILIKDKKVSAASKILENYVAPYDSTVTQKLKEAGMIILGRANLDEFAMGGSTEYSAFGVTKNPHDTSRVAGGSSGGSACSVAADFALCSLGSDTGGSVRLPSAFCGTVGLKPTYGSVSRYGLIAMASSFDVIGPIAKTVEDAELLFNAIKGIDELDSTTASNTTSHGGNKIESGATKKIGVPRSFLKEGMDSDVLENFNQSLEKLRNEGHEIIDIDLPSLEYSLAVYYILVPAEVSSNMARYDGIKYGESLDGKDLIEGYFKTRGKLLGEEVKRRIMLGTYVLSSGYADEYYRNAWKVRNQIKKEFENKFKEIDIIATPVSTNPANKIGEMVANPLKAYLIDVFTVSANVAGIPAISVPSGTVNREVELPVGIQFMTSWNNEQLLFEISKKFEKIR